MSPTRRRQMANSPPSQYVPRPSPPRNIYPWPAIEATLHNGQAFVLKLSGSENAFRNALYQRAKRMHCKGHIQKIGNGPLVVWLTPTIKASEKQASVRTDDGRPDD
jgi:hypothetical protein